MTVETNQNFISVSSVIGGTLVTEKYIGYSKKEAVEKYVLDKGLPTVTCNQCGWEGYEEDLSIEKDGLEFFRACPECKTDSCLMDIDYPN